MKKQFLNITRFSLSVIFAALIFAACNKKFEAAQAIEGQSGNTLISAIITEPNYSFFRLLVRKSGDSAALNTLTNSFTVFLPNNAAFIASGIPSEAAVNSLSATTAAGIVKYALIPGERWLSSQIPTTFPNLQLPTALTLGNLTPLIPLKASIFPSKRGNGFWANNIPVITPDLQYANGVIHVVDRLVTPPSQVLAQTIYGDPQLTLFSALVARGDQGQTGLNRIDSVFKYAVASLTVAAPTNTAMKEWINAASGGAIPLAAPDATFLSFINTSLPVSSARGIVVYHIGPVRAFGVNFPPAPGAFFPTLLNGGVPTHPGVKVEAAFTGQYATGLKFTGVANGGIAANAITLDKHAVNGVVHIIDRVLLPF